MTTEQAYNDLLNDLVTIYERREAVTIADWIFENVTGWKALERRFQKHTALSADKVQVLKKYHDELVHHKPVQYVLSEAWFFRRKFYVSENVLIPRPETEELVEWVLKDLQTRPVSTAGKRTEILDIGTGSGCIPISLKNELMDVSVTAVDISSNALSVAEKNAGTLHADINFIQLDFLNENDWNSLGVYDIVVSNPPYIPKEEKSMLEKNVTEFEPGIALFVNGDNSFIFYESIAKFAISHLAPNGNAYVEIHEKDSAEVNAIFLKYNFKTELRKDIYGRERMIKATLI